MFKDVTNATGQQVEDGKYIGKLLSVEDGGESTFKQGERRIIWKWNLADYASRQLVRSQDGEAYEFWSFTSDNMGPRATARKNIEALLNRELQPGEAGAGFVDQIVGQKATLLIAKNDNERAVIMSISPFTNGTQKQEPEPVAVAAAAEPEF